MLTSTKVADQAIETNSANASDAPTPPSQAAVMAALSRFAHADVYKREIESRAPLAFSRVDAPIDTIVGSLKAIYPAATESDLVLALAAIYLLRVNGDNTISFAFCNATTHSMTGSQPSPAGLQVFDVGLTRDDTFSAVVARVTQKRCDLAALVRTEAPALSLSASQAERMGDSPLPFLIGITDGDVQFDRHQADVTLTIDLGTGRATLVLDPAIDPAFSTIVFDHLRTLATGLASLPTTPIGRCPLLSEAERDRIVNKWNATVRSYPYEGGLVKSLELQARLAPNQPAVVYQGDVLTYQLFNAKVNRLARHLRGLGAGPETFVAICLDRSADLVIAIWAVLKSGAAYVPLNTEDPQKRLATIVRNANARIIITEDRLVEKLPKSKVRIVNLTRDAEAIAAWSDDNIDNVIAPDQTAYMIYTSGSTGTPKGVVIEHAAIHNRIMWMQHTFHLTADDRVLQKTPYTFDVSVWEFLWPVTAGATLVVAEPGGHVVPSYLVRLIRHERITCLHFVPSVLRLFLRCPGLETLPLRMVFCSGEALTSDLVQSFFEVSSAQLNNLYGPTEAAVDVTHWACRRETAAIKPPIGKPIDNVTLYVLDEDLQPVPVGVPGELHIGGVQVARGYWERPELTEERFIASPFSQDPRARLYKTGDIARFLPTGDIDYLGRNDHQVKINGIRTELGEIETIIRSHAAVDDVVVIAMKSECQNTQLCAYLRLKANSTGDPTQDHIRAYLEGRLSPPMIPRAFIFMESFPLTANGKVDRKALPAPDFLSGA